MVKIIVVKDFLDSLVERSLLVDEIDKVMVSEYRATCFTILACHPLSTLP